MARALITLVFCLFFVPVVAACYSFDPLSEFKLIIYDLKINHEELTKNCDQDSCLKKGDAIVIRSNYDERVSLVIAPSSVVILLPYSMDGNNKAAVSEIDPKQFDWSQAIKTDLEFLKNKNVLSLSDQEVKDLAAAGRSHPKIVFCGERWTPANLNGHCHKGQIIFAKCAGQMDVQKFVLPVKGLK